MMPSSRKMLDSCSHPKEFETRGANQHGTWTRCSLCQSKTGYQKYGKNNPPPAARKAKSVAVETYVSAPSTPAPRTPLPVTSGPVPSIMPDLETAFQGQNQQLAHNTAAIMAQVMTPVVEGFHLSLIHI